MGAAPFDPPPAAPVRVLVVDEVPEWRRILRLMLAEDRRFEVFDAGSIEEAVAMLRNPALRPDVLLTDLFFLGTFEVDSVRRIRLESGLPDLPIAVLAGRLVPDDPLYAFLGGADAFIAKPVSRHELIGKLWRLARGSGTPAADSEAVPPDARGDQQRRASGAA